MDDKGRGERRDRDRLNVVEDGPCGTDVVKTGDFEHDVDPFRSDSEGGSTDADKTEEVPLMRWK